MSGFNSGTMSLYIDNWNWVSGGPPPFDLPQTIAKTPQISNGVFSFSEADTITCVHAYIPPTFPYYIGYVVQRRYTALFATPDDGISHYYYFDLLAQDLGPFPGYYATTDYYLDQQIEEFGLGNWNVIQPIGEHCFWQPAPFSVVSTINHLFGGGVLDPNSLFRITVTFAISYYFFWPAQNQAFVNDYYNYLCSMNIYCPDFGGIIPNLPNTIRMILEQN